jgi:acetoacetyl-CoA synthetase
MKNTTSPAWNTSESLSNNSAMTRFITWATRETSLPIEDYTTLWDWSVAQPADFWSGLARFFDLSLDTDDRGALAVEAMPGAVWFPAARTNYATQVLRHAQSGGIAIRHQSEAGDMVDMSWADLDEKVTTLAAALQRLGIVAGDRVVGYLPNTPDTIVAFLACASIGAVWSLCAPDMGAPTVLERFRQIAPKAIFTRTHYDFGGKSRDRSAEVSALLAGLPSLESWITLDAATGVTRPGTVTRHDWGDLLAGSEQVRPRPLPFDHPLWVVYSSGTTGSPKAIVHGHGGVVLEHLKLVGLHCDVTPVDTFSWYSSTGWIMWNVHIGGLLTGATIAIAEGSPGFPDNGRLWRFIETAGVTVFGAGAAWYSACMKAGIHPKGEADLTNLKMLGSTGSPLPPEAYEWLRQTVRDDIWIAPIAGGTDLAGVFLAGSPTLPVHVGEMQCRALGAAVYAFDHDGQVVTDDVGELVCTRPMPSMPLYLWGDADGTRLHESYFDTFPGIWRQGDWVRITARGSGIIYGRSDATINRYGIRMGTSDIYRVVEDRDDVLDSLVVDLEYLGKPSCMILFVKLGPGIGLDERLKATIVQDLKTRVSPHHVPDLIEAAPDIPYTLTGKKLEVPIKKRLLGKSMPEVVTQDAMANPDCLAWYDAYSEAHLAR